MKVKELKDVLFSEFQSEENVMVWDDNTQEVIAEKITAEEAMKQYGDLTLNRITTDVNGGNFIVLHVDSLLITRLKAIKALEAFSDAYVKLCDLWEEDGYWEVLNEACGMLDLDDYGLFSFDGCFGELGINFWVSDMRSALLKQNHDEAHVEEE